MNTVEALKELYKSFGGKLTDTYSNIADGIPVGNYSVIPDCFAALAEIAGGSIELPVVTQADAGDVLTVGEDGKWTNAEPAKELPTVTASDNGTLLGVVDGAWAKGLKIKKKTVSYTVDNATTNSFSPNIFEGDDVKNKCIIGINVPENFYILANSSNAEITFSYLGYGMGPKMLKMTCKIANASQYFTQTTYNFDVYYIDLA